MLAHRNSCGILLLTLLAGDANVTPARDACRDNADCNGSVDDDDVSLLQIYTSPTGPEVSQLLQGQAMMPMSSFPQQAMMPMSGFPQQAMTPMGSSPQQAMMPMSSFAQQATMPMSSAAQQAMMPMSSFAQQAMTPMSSAAQQQTMSSLAQQAGYIAADSGMQPALAPGYMPVDSGGWPAAAAGYYVPLQPAAQATAGVPAVGDMQTLHVPLQPAAQATAGVPAVGDMQTLQVPLQPAAQATAGVPAPGDMQTLHVPPQLAATAGVPAPGDMQLLSIKTNASEDASAKTHRSEDASAGTHGSEGASAVDSKQFTKLQDSVEGEMLANERLSNRNEQLQVEVDDEVSQNNLLKKELSSVKAALQSAEGRTKAMSADNRRLGDTLKQQKAFAGSAANQLTTLFDWVNMAKPQFTEAVEKAEELEREKADAEAKLEKAQLASSEAFREARMAKEKVALEAAKANGEARQLKEQALAQIHLIQAQAVEEVKKARAEGKAEGEAEGKAEGKAEGLALGKAAAGDVQAQKKEAARLLQMAQAAEENAAKKMRQAEEKARWALATQKEAAGAAAAMEDLAKVQANLLHKKQPDVQKPTVS